MAKATDTPLDIEKFLAGGGKLFLSKNSWVSLEHPNGCSESLRLSQMILGKGLKLVDAGAEVELKG